MENKFQPKYIDSQNEKWNKLPGQPGWDIPNQDVQLISKLHIDGSSLPLYDKNLLVFRDFPALRHLVIDLARGSPSAHIHETKAARRFMTSLRCVEARASQLKTFSCSHSVSGHLVNRVVKNFIDEADEGDEQAWKNGLEAFGQQKSWIEMPLEQKNIVRNFELEWTFYLQRGWDDSYIGYHLEFGWGGREWPRDENGQKMIRCQIGEDLTSDMGFQEKFTKNIWGPAQCYMSEVESGSETYKSSEWSDPFELSSEEESEEGEEKIDKRGHAFLTKALWA